MVKYPYISEKNFQPAKRRLLAKLTAIIDEYREAGYTMTLRQLYYQLVAKAIIPNKKSEYGKLSDLLKDARLMGIIDWDFIEDRIRVPKMPSEFADIPELVEAAIQSYRRPRWKDQDRYVEVWVEKDALSGVLAPVCRRWHVRLLVNRGFSSVTAMHDAALRFQEAEEEGKECHLLYLGDHDPSGEDMVRDIDSRLNETFGRTVEVEKLALTWDQIQQYTPPPNPVKLSDSRAAAYIEKYGSSSWELDALPPNVLTEIVESAIVQQCDVRAYEAVKTLEEQEKQRLKDFAEEEFDQDNDDAAD